ncbi:MAG TPA: DUF5362 family protein [Mucilaginibacter sp.]|jgi:hypothetical protein|nr:DUF5362 family protein [Mucilaginibacter sp.]
MDTNDAIEQTVPEPGIVLTLEAQSYLLEAGKWAYFLGIVGFIMTGFILLCAFFVGAIFSLMTKYQPATTPYPAGVGGVMSFLYILIAIFYFFFSFYLYKFGNRIKKGIGYNDALEVGSALEKLKSFFKLWGITTIVILAFYALMIVIVVVVGIGTATLLHK